MQYILQDLIYDNIDYTAYENKIGELCCEFILEKCNEILPGIVKSITFENIQSPKQYNFSTDSINCIIELDFNKLLQTFARHQNAGDYLKDTYTSCSGYISHYPNNISAWITEAFDDQKHTAGAMLDILLESAIEEDTGDSGRISMYYDISENIYAGEYINYDNILSAINEKYTHNPDLTEFSDLEGFTPIKRG